MLEYFQIPVNMCQCIDSVIGLLSHKYVSGLSTEVGDKSKLNSFVGKNSRLQPRRIFLILNFAPSFTFYVFYKILYII